MARQALVVLIQAHEKRRDLAEALLESLDGRARIVWDPEPDGICSPWRTYRHAIETAPDDATHLLIVQEDATPCVGFRDVVEDVVATRPDDVLVLCVTSQNGRCRLTVQQACQRGESWAELPRGHWVSAIATCWPAQTARDLVSWVDEQGYPEGFTADDEIIGRYTSASGIVPVATVPSLVDHEDVVPSILSRRFRRGRDPNRQAAIFVDKDCDCLASEIDWTV